MKNSKTVAWFKAGARWVIKLGCVLSFLILGSSLITGGWAQGKSSVKHASAPILTMQTQSSGTVMVGFSSTPDGASLAGANANQAMLDLGVVSYGRSPRVSNVEMRKLRDRFVVATRFGLNIQDPSRRFTTAAVLASIARPENVYTLWLDGVKLQTTPQMIQGQVRMGAASSEHRLEIEVPLSVTEKDSQLRNAVVFQIVPN